MSHYYGVIGNRDHIKYKEKKRPYWEFLDRQPDGWLTSIVYRRAENPAGKRMIFDCGAWSYKDREIPVIGNRALTPELALEFYTEMGAKPGDFLVAPDHMLLPKYASEMSARRGINELFAKLFIDECASLPYVPMGVVHGFDLDERISHARYLYDLGYRAISLGGMAGRASAKRENVGIVEAIRFAFPGVWLHVLGLSSPSYAEEWARIGVDSFDGSSHFKQAFTAGTFFTEKDGDLMKHQAARTDRETGEVIGEITAPICHCKACAMMREEGIDTRTYGSNENNMGRAAHNQNMLMRAHSYRMRPTTVLVSCVGEKMQKPTPAGDLYRSDWFLKAKAYAATISSNWAILSAEHGLLMPDAVVSPYEKTLNTMSVDERKEWAASTFRQIREKIPAGKIVILAGARYREHLTPVLTKHGYDVEVPMEGMGIGQQLAFMKSAIEPDYSQLKLIKEI